MSRSAYGFSTPTATADDWRHQSACRNEDPELFFPVGTSGPALLQVERAKAVCRRCPSAGECLTWALKAGEVGVWGGTSDMERPASKRRGAGNAEYVRMPSPKCQSGLHDMTKDNTGTNRSNGRVIRQCKACRRARDERRAAA